MFNNIKVKVKKDKVVVYIDGTFSKEEIMRFDIDSYPFADIKLSKEMRKAIEKAIVDKKSKELIKHKMKALEDEFKEPKADTTDTTNTTDTTDTESTE
jgi:hypothetical protein